MSFLKKNFGDFTKNEVEIAFNDALSGKMPVRDINHYNNLTPQWITPILNKYKELRAKPILEYEHELNRLKREQESKLTGSEIKMIMLDGLKLAYDTYRSGKKEEVNHHGLYEFLEKTLGELHSPEDKTRIMSLATDVVVSNKKVERFKETNEFKVGDLSRDIKNIMSGGASTNGNVIAEARKIALFDYFDSLMEKKVTNIISELNS